ncbi:MAG: phosphoribosylformylglycinamidine synthase, partial [Bdellovibrionales bacterium]|nr:phosphoribosylformylglycinamidine synthase [Bdellovibrionales bacterium]
MTTHLFENDSNAFIVQTEGALSDAETAKVEWMLKANKADAEKLSGSFVGARREMVSPWSTNATDIAWNLGVTGVRRIERFEKAGNKPTFDKMTEMHYSQLDSSTLVIDAEPAPVRHIENISDFNAEAGLALSQEEVAYLEQQSADLGRKLTDAEVFAFGQINSEHCRHKIFNGTFVIDGEEMDASLFALIKKTSKHSPNNIVSAYSDNVAFLKGPEVLQFAPKDDQGPSEFGLRRIESVISLKAETHNFPTTVEPFNGASTGSGGEIRDRMAGGIGSLPLVGTAVYMTSYPRIEEGSDHWKPSYSPRKWKYQTPEEILIKASNGASDFGNKFGQPLITGSLLTYEGESKRGFYAYDRCIMLAGGVGYANLEHAHKSKAKPGDKLVVLGGDNYRIGLGGGSVSSVDTGDVARELELSAIQRANPEMQKRVYNVIRALAERSSNPISLIHDHGAGGHINCFSELLEENGGRIDLSALPVGDKTLSALELIANESQERMGLIVSAADVELLQKIAERERAPLYVVGEVTGDGQLVFASPSGEAPVDVPLETLFGSTPHTRIEATSISVEEDEVVCDLNSGDQLAEALEKVLSLEGVACKDWLTNKVDRSVSGYVALQQCCGPLHIPLNDVGVAALDYSSCKGIATAIGHAPVVGLIDERAGAVLSIAESLTNTVFAPLDGGLKSISLSANWMWPAKQEGEDARLYRAVQAVSDFCCQLGIPVPTGKDSLSMTMKYGDGSEVRAPGTVVISSSAPVTDVRRVVTADLKADIKSTLIYANFSGMHEYPLGGSAFAQSQAMLGRNVPNVKSVEHFAAAFNALQKCIAGDLVLAGHDVSAGGLITAICEMAFAGDCGVEIDVATNNASDTAAMLFCEKPGVVLQVAEENRAALEKIFKDSGVEALAIGSVADDNMITCNAGDLSFRRPVSSLRSVWFEPSWKLDRRQTKPELADQRRDSLGAHPLEYSFPHDFTGAAADFGLDLVRTKPGRAKAAIIREKGTNGDREMAFAMYSAGFDVQ